MQRRSRRKGPKKGWLWGLAALAGLAAVAVAVGLRVPCPLPSRYDLREHRKNLTVSDQGELGTCWAFAALSALETTMPPKLSQKLSADHMSLRNSFGTDQDAGGDYTMAMAYLLAWQGPVAEAEDAYGDGYSPEGLRPLCHVQEIRMLPGRDFTAIKEAVLRYGGVQSSLYLSAENRESGKTVFHQGNEEPNHDVVIVGWDDGYPKERFPGGPKKDGAFLCMNSWGRGFGDQGFFYVSYEDRSIGRYGVVYSGVEAADNDDRIYQTDLCGWTGQLGYGSSGGWFGNVYEAKEEELLSAAGFYATAGETEYQVYVRKLSEPGELAPETGMPGTLAASGTFSDAGFYTVALDQEIPLEAGCRFAVFVHIDTPGTTQPIAVEYGAGSGAEGIDITDGEGYISFDGRTWERAEENYGCNLCLKAYSRRRT